MSEALQQVIRRNRDGKYYAYSKDGDLKFVSQKRYAFCTDDPVLAATVIKHVRILEPKEVFHLVPRYMVQL